ncbi:MAG: hypothetical protein J6V20_02095 [Bacteroidaceae bacterium]|nr:hypothetical protein [Bacteroidaceae bacterium]
MRKFLLLIAVALFSTATYAQLWSKSISAVAEGDAVSLNSPAAMDKDGNLYVTGTKTLPIEFAGNEVGGEDTGAYIAKYNAEGVEQYAIELIGSIDITAITTDAENNLYVAGSFAGGAMIQGVTGDPKTISNTEMDSKTAAFIAKYSAEGELLAVKSYVAALPSEDIWDLVSVSIEKIVADGSKVYVEFDYTGNVAVEENLSLSAKYISVDFGFMIYCMVVNNVSVISFDSDFTNPTEIATLTVADNAGQATKLFSTNFTVENGNVYVAALATGDIVMTTSAGTEALNFTTTDDGTGNMEEGAILAKVGEKTVKLSNELFAGYGYYNVISGMELKNGKLYIAGTFEGSLAFANETVAVGASDAFVASVDANELTVDWAVANANDEGATNQYYEAVSAVVLGNESVTVFDAVVDMNNNEAPVAKNYTVSYEGVITETEEAIAATAVAYNANNIAVINYTNETIVTMYDSALTTTAIESVVAEAENNVIYDITGRRVEKITNAGIYIINGNKVLVK